MAKCISPKYSLSFATSATYHQFLQGIRLAFAGHNLAVAEVFSKSKEEMEARSKSGKSAFSKREEQESGRWGSRKQD